MKQKLQNSSLFALRIVGLSFMTVILMVSSLHPEKAIALSSTEIRAQVNALQQQINEGKAKARELAAQADSLRKAIAALDNQIAQDNAQIEQTGLRIADLQDKLVKTQAELDRQTGLLRDSMRAL